MTLLTTLTLLATLAAPTPTPTPTPTPQPYYVVLYRYPDHRDSWFDRTPQEVEALLAHDGARHFEEISHGHLTLEARVHPEVVLLSDTLDGFSARGKAGPLRTQDAICQIERRHPCASDNRRRGHGGVDLRPFVVDGHLRLILLGTSSGGSRRSHTLHTAMSAAQPAEVLAWGIDGSAGASASHGNGWRVGAEEVAHHLLAVGDYYRQRRHERPFWTRPAAPPHATVVHRDIATGWAKTQDSWIHPTPWDKRLQRSARDIERRPFWPLGAQARSIPPDSEQTLLLHPAELTLPDTQVVLLPFADSEPERPFHGYLLEHRRRLGADEPVAAEGLLVWLVRDTRDLPGRGPLLHRKSRAVLMSRVTDDLEAAPYRPGDTFRDPARGIEVHVVAGDVGPTGALRLSIRRTPPPRVELAVTRFEVTDTAAGAGDALWPEAKGELEITASVTTTAAVRGARLALQARTGDSGPWTLIREGILDLDPGPHPLTFAQPKRFRDPWSGSIRAGRLAELLAGAVDVGAELRLVVWHEADASEGDDVRVVGPSVRAGQPPRR